MSDTERTNRQAERDQARRDHFRQATGGVGITTDALHKAQDLGILRDVRDLASLGLIPTNLLPTRGSVDDTNADEITEDDVDRYHAGFHLLRDVSRIVHDADDLTDPQTRIVRMYEDLKETLKGPRQAEGSVSRFAPRELPSWDALNIHRPKIDANDQGQETSERSESSS